MKLPLVAIVGRPNVGKSSLLNCLANERVSIVDPTPGVTRDRVGTVLFHGDVTFELVDTGGIGIIDRDDLSEDIERQIGLALHGADLILFVVDAQEGPQALDRQVAQRLRESPELQERPRPVILVANKVDGHREEDDAAAFFELGFGAPFAVSALHGFGRSDLLDLIVSKIPPTGAIDTEPVMRLCLAGRQNVGKSTLVNALAREDRVIVSEIPGTTRDAVDVRFEKDGRTFVVIDTAGLKRRTKVKGSIEFYSQVRTQEAMRRSDVVLFMIDASEDISRVDKKISETVVEESKPCIIVVNKWDLSRGQVETERYARYATDQLPALAWAPLVFTTARDSRNVQAVVDLAQHLWKRARARVGTGELNRLIERLRQQHGPTRVKGKAPKIYYCTQVGTQPPTFVFFVNDPKLFPKGYRRTIENAFREMLPFAEIPLRLFFRAREQGGGG